MAPAEMPGMMPEMMNDEDRIVGGFPIPITRAPYQIVILFKNGNLQCGGQPFFFKFK